MVAEGDKARELLILLAGRARVEKGSGAVNLWCWRDRGRGN